ncbi:hypothetical protein ABGB12_17090 [Actinocorallia sp. B10E7]|uniref:hypothetical protein n=1 Tax=Actinocorallia sp. B10E7 TaxID=3153558 RepID=UPI00325E4697
MTTKNRAEKTESLVQLAILLLVGGMAGAASFTHVHDWTMDNSPAGTGDWFGWANAVISELTPIAAGLEIRRRKRNGQKASYPLAVLVASAAFSISAQLAVAKPGITGGLIAALPALAFLALTKLVMSRPATPTAPVAEPATEPAVTHTSGDLVELEPAPSAETAPHDDGLAVVDEPPHHLLAGARMAAFSHRQTTGQAITTDALADHLGIPKGTAAQLLHHLGAESGHVNGFPVLEGRA